MFCPKCKKDEYFYTHSNGKRTGLVCKSCGYEPNKINAGDTTKHHISPQETQSTAQNRLLYTGALSKAERDLHNNCVKFKVIKFVEVSWNRLEGFNAPIYVMIYQGFNVQYMKNWLKIFSKGRNFTDLNGLEPKKDEILKKLTEIALEIATKNGFEIEPIPIIFRQENKTPYLSHVNFVEKEAQSVYAKNGELGKIEFKGENCIQNDFNLTQALITLNENILLEIENKKLHQKVLIDMSDTLREIANNGHSTEKEADHAFTARLKEIPSEIDCLTKLRNSALRLSEEVMRW
jgi:DNA-directed RNA polymerase subunit M/transcription elongation factor TFIIS